MRQEVQMRNTLMRDPVPLGTYNPGDVTFLLKDLSSLMSESSLEEREWNIQNGGHYSEMLPNEYQPSEEYLSLFHKSLLENAEKVALSVGIVAERILQRRGADLVLVSLARAGTPVGILIKRYIREFYNHDLPHYSISIIRGKGIDVNALRYLCSRYPEAGIQFIDGWTGKGAITRQLIDACQFFKNKFNYPLNDDLAVLADPGQCVSTFGTREDFLIPSACLNSTVSGLVSRTVYREDLIGVNDFHGAKFYKELADCDVSYIFLDTIIACYKKIHKLAQQESLRPTNSKPTWQGLRDIQRIQQEYSISDINLIKPGVGETTRVLLRRMPWKVLIDREDNPNLQHVFLLAREKGVPLEVYPNLTYSCCGIVKGLNDL